MQAVVVLDPPFGSMDSCAGWRTTLSCGGLECEEWGGGAHCAQECGRTQTTALLHPPVTVYLEKNKLELNLLQLVCGG